MSRPCGHTERWCPCRRHPWRLQRNLTPLLGDTDWQRDDRLGGREEIRQLTRRLTQGDNRERLTDG